MLAGRNRKSVWLGMLAFAALASCSLVAAQEKQGKRPFTVEDDIAFVHFPSNVDAYTGAWGFAGGVNDGIQFSPNGEFFAVITARGRLDADQVEESLRFYRTKEVESYLNRSGLSEAPAPEWVAKRSAKEDAIVSYQWLADSSGVVLREQTGDLNDRVVLLDLHKKSTETLPFGAGVYQGFAIRDREHYVSMAFDEASRKELEKRLRAEQEAPVRAFAGGIYELLKPDELWMMVRQLLPKRKVRAAVGGQPFEVKHDGTPLDPADFDFTTLALSPDGQTILTRMQLKSIPSGWEKVYLPPYPSAAFNNIHAGGSASIVVRIELKTGAIQPLIDAPPSGEAGWSPGGDYGAVWSSDGEAILLSGTFLESKGGEAAPPCVAVLDLASHTSSCVEKLKARGGPNLELPEGYHNVMSAEFVEGDKNLVEITFSDRNEAAGTIEYQRTSRGDWEVVSERKGIHPLKRNGLEISVKQAFDEPPMLMASQQSKSKVIWDPNPQFRDIDLVEPKIYRWKGKDGKDWEGGLYLPSGYQTGKRYPLVIQTHGFTESTFLPSGSFPTAFAARELAGAGIAVLQVGGGTNCPIGTANGAEAACYSSGFEAGARQLASDGIIDLEKVGYIGFSRTCWFGMEMLTKGSLRLKAAALDDGIMADYFQSALGGSDFKDELGVKPFGDGLEEWVKRSPGFYLDRVRAPLLLGTERGASGALEMWQPYTGLRALNKPVEMQILNTDEHVITNPVERLASQGLSVDWFRFWLQGYEEASAAKAEQYKRWRGLRELQAENDKKSAEQQAAQAAVR